MQTQDPNSDNTQNLNPTDKQVTPQNPQEQLSIQPAETAQTQIAPQIQNPTPQKTNLQIGGLVEAPAAPVNEPFDLDAQKSMIAGQSPFAPQKNVISSVDEEKQAEMLVAESLHQDTQNNNPPGNKIKFPSNNRIGLIVGGIVLTIGILGGIYYFADGSNFLTGYTKLNTPQETIQKTETPQEKDKPVSEEKTNNLTTFGNEPASQANSDSEATSDSEAAPDTENKPSSGLTVPSAGIPADSYPQIEPTYALKYNDKDELILTLTFTDPEKKNKDAYTHFILVGDEKEFDAKKLDTQSDEFENYVITLFERDAKPGQNYSFDIPFKEYSDKDKWYVAILKGKQKSDSKLDPLQPVSSYPSTEIDIKSFLDNSDITVDITQFSDWDDIKDEWYADGIEFWADKNILKGEEINGKTFVQPDKPLNKAEIYITYMSIFEPYDNSKINYDDYEYNDPNTPLYSKPYIVRAIELGYINDKTGFDGYLSVDRMYAMEKLVRYLNLDYKSMPVPDLSDTFSDWDLLKDDEKKMVKALGQIAVFENSGKLNPRMQVTRADIYMLCYRAYQKDLIEEFPVD